MSNSKFQFPEAEELVSWCLTDGDQSTRGNGMLKFGWKIKDFQNRPEEKGEYVSSNVFKAQSSQSDADAAVTKWIIRVYPKGRNDSEDICISLANDSDVQVQASGKLLIMNEEDRLLEILSFKKDELIVPGWFREISLDDDVDVLPSELDDLTILFHIQIHITSGGKEKHFMKIYLFKN